jgi:hypothetical protein
MHLISVRRNQNWSQPKPREPYCGSCFLVRTQKTGAPGSLFSTARCLLVGCSFGPLVIGRRTTPREWVSAVEGPPTRPRPYGERGTVERRGLDMRSVSLAKRDDRQPADGASELPLHESQPDVYLRQAAPSQRGGIDLASVVQVIAQLPPVQDGLVHHRRTDEHNLLRTCGGLPQPGPFPYREQDGEPNVRRHLNNIGIRRPVAAYMPLVATRVPERNHPTGQGSRGVGMRWSALALQHADTIRLPP